VSISKKVIVSVTNDLCTDQRVHKVCNSLQGGGYQVVLVGRRLRFSPDLSKRSYITKRFNLIFNTGPLFYLNYNLRLFLYLLFNRFDIVLSNDLDSLLANFVVSEIKRKRLVYDSHEYFTEVPELINRPKVQFIWKCIESSILPKVKYSYTVGQKIADAYKKKYRVKMGVVRNFPTIKPKETKVESDRKVVLYQGALNIGRGLEELIESFNYVSNAELQIAGTGDIESELKSLTKDLKLESKIKFLGRLSILDLHKTTMKANLGVSLEKGMGLNYEYAVPNKIFDYIQAGVPVLYSPLVEVVDLLSPYVIGESLESHDPMIMGQQINRMLISSENEFWKAECAKAALIFNWEKEEEKLLNIFNRIA
jgi:glycosyltransferase involved in cell wall biosynthesis